MIIIIIIIEYDMIVLKVKEEQAPTISAEATYGGFKAPTGAILQTRKEGPKYMVNNCWN